MKILKTTFFSAFFAVSTSGAFALDLTEDMKSTDEITPLSFDVGCGNLKKANCTEVVPRINTQLQQYNITVSGAKSQGSIQSLEAICKGKVAAAVAQLDAVLQVVNNGKTPCPVGINVVGQGIYPYYVRVIVPNDSPFKKFSRMLEGKARISAGGKGSGGNVIMDNYFRASPDVRDHVTLDFSSVDEAMGKLSSGQLDAILIADGPMSEEVNMLTTKKDGQGKFAFRTINFDPPRTFFDLKSFDGRSPLYRWAKIKVSGWWNDIDTVQVNAVWAMGGRFYRANESRLEGMDPAITNALAGIREAVQAPVNWKPTE